MRIRVIPTGSNHLGQNEVVITTNARGRTVIMVQKPSDQTEQFLSALEESWHAVYEKMDGGLWTLVFSQSLGDSLEELRHRPGFELIEPEVVAPAKQHAPIPQGRFGMRGEWAPVAE